MNLKIIIVDDSEISRTSISKILTDEGYNVVGTAGTAKSALQLLGTTECNLFIIDVVMPESSGIDLAKTLNEQQIKCRFIMISSLDLEAVVIEAISQGAVDFIKKPFTKENIIDAVQRAEKVMSED